MVQLWFHLSNSVKVEAISIVGAFAFVTSQRTFLRRTAIGNEYMEQPKGMKRK
jgi:hypothetical protein